MPAHYHISELHCIAIFPLPLNILPLIRQEIANKPSEVLNIWLQTGLLPVRNLLLRPRLHRSIAVLRRHLAVSILIYLTVFGIPLVDLTQQFCDRGYVEGVELFHLAFSCVDGHAHASSTRMNTERALQQVIQLLRDLGIKSGVRVLENDILPCIVQRVLVQLGTYTRFSKLFYVVPFLGAGSVGRRLPFGFEGVVQCAVGEEVEEGSVFVVGFPRVLGGEDVGAEVLAEEVEAASVILY